MADDGVRFYPEPNKALTAILTGATGTLRNLLQAQADRGKILYQGKVAKRTRQLMRSAKAYVALEDVAKGEPRLVGKISVGGIRAVARWNSPRNPNPSGAFYYGVLHEFGTISDGGGLTEKQQRLLDGLRRLAADRAAFPGEKKAALERISKLEAKTERRRLHQAALDLQWVVKAMSA